MTVAKYEVHARKLFIYLKKENILTPRSARTFDRVLSNYINYLWEDDFDHGMASSTLSALVRFLPELRHGLPISRQYLNNWQRILHRKQALALPKHIVFGMVGYAVAHDMVSFGVVLLVGIRCLLRTMEAVDLRVRDIKFLFQSNKVCLFLENSKRASRIGIPEHVFCDIPMVVQALHEVVKDKDPNEFIYQGNQSSFGQTVRFIGE